MYHYSLNYIKPISRSEIAVFLIIITAFNCVNGSNPGEIVKSYDKINRYLLKKLGERSEDLLVIKFHLGEKLDKVKEQSWLLRDKYHQEALINILNLINLENYEKCSIKTLRLLEYSDIGTEGRAREDWNPFHARAIDKLIYGLFMDHAEFCEKVYEAKFKDFYPKVDEKIIEDIEPFLAALIDERIAQLKLDNKIGRKTFYHKNIINPHSLSRVELDMLMNEAIRRSKVDEAKSWPKRSLLSYIKKPCEKYRQALELLGPAAFDQVLIKSSPTMEYFRVLTYYNTCTLISSPGTLHDLRRMCKAKRKKATDCESM